MSYAAAMVMAEARRRRDSRGRYMEGGAGQNEANMGYATNEQENEMRRGGNQNEMAYNEGGSGGEMRRGGNRNEMAYNESGQGGEMRRGGRRNETAYNEGGQGSEMRRGGNRNEMAYNEGGQGGQMRRGGRGNRNEMGGEGYFAWDGEYPVPYLTPERYGRPGMEDGGNITNMREYEQRRSMGAMNHKGGKWQKEKMQSRIGFGEQEDDDDDDEEEKEPEGKLTKEHAEKWIRSMKTPDDKPLQPVPMSEIQRIAPNYGVEGEHKLVEFWLVVNMMKSDYQDMGAKYAGNAVDFYAGLAKDWMHDKDAVPNKLKMYKKYIVQKEK